MAQRSALTYINEDLFSILSKPQSSFPVILAHSCNCYGSWGGGIAYQFAKRFPSALNQYQTHCASFSSNPQKLLGSTLLIKINPKDFNHEGDYLIACLFTSLLGQESPTEIAQYTQFAILDMVTQLQGKKNCDLEEVQDLLTKYDINEENLVINIPKINSGIFNVPWEMTEEVLAETGLQYNVYSL
ncbi:hypothetical protein PACTADRAFT_1247 [Pachysolen tannophilus NRRL Y-2460]|uniref:ADP-ribose 1''-phosphate phosphatase n=1 Tax=Pachysolen tannophilus NRRL Y-2460 TaxID=669874 RepID=A0A1E4TY18_PACTA|nr:hypothetical protein PACTADRAFT_1247 [Pachysolen tannophilus NRRL Y-2460]